MTNWQLSFWFSYLLSWGIWIPQLNRSKPVGFPLITVIIFLWNPLLVRMLLIIFITTRGWWWCPFLDWNKLLQNRPFRWRCLLRTLRVAIQIILTRSSRQLLLASFNGWQKNKKNQQHHRKQKQKRKEEPLWSSSQNNKSVWLVFLLRYLEWPVPRKEEALWRTPESYGVLLLMFGCSQGIPSSNSAFSQWKNTFYGSQGGVKKKSEKNSEREKGYIRKCRFVEAEREREKNMES